MDVPVAFQSIPHQVSLCLKLQMVLLLQAAHANYDANVILPQLCHLLKYPHSQGVSLKFLLE